MAISLSNINTRLTNLELTKGKLVQLFSGGTPGSGNRTITLSQSMRLFDLLCVTMRENSGAGDNGFVIVATIYPISTVVSGTIIGSGNPMTGETNSGNQFKYTSDTQLRETWKQSGGSGIVGVWGLKL